MTQQNGPHDSYWGTYQQQHRMRFIHQVVPTTQETHLESPFAQEGLDLFLLKERLSEVTRKLEADNYSGELVPRAFQSQQMLDESGKRIPGTNDELKIRLQVEKAMIEQAIQNNPISRVCYFLLCFKRSFFYYFYILGFDYTNGAVKYEVSERSLFTSQ